MKKRLYLRLWQIAVMSISISVASSSGQSGSGAIRGRITDASGAVLQGAQVYIQPKAAAPAVTNQQGEFTILNLALELFRYSFLCGILFIHQRTLAVSAGTAHALTPVLGAASKTEQVEVYASVNMARRRQSTASSPRPISCRCCRSR